MIELFQQLPRWVRLSFVFPLLFLNGFLLAKLIDYLQPFVSFLITAAILAFLLEMLIQLFVRQGFNRGWAIASVFLLAVFLIVVLSLILFPIMASQLSQLLDNLPQWFDSTSESLNKFAQTPFARRFNLNSGGLIPEALKRVSNALESVGSQALNLLQILISSALNGLIVLILTIFLLVGGESFWEGLFSWIPQPWRDRLPIYLGKTFRDYFFSRALLAGVSTIVRAIIFVVLGVPYSLLFAVLIGIASLIPFVAGLVILGSSFLLCFHSPTLAFWFLVTAVIIDNLTDNVFAPRIMGNLIGLNPVWIIISLFIGAKLGGILGLFLAVPLASVIKHVIGDLKAESRQSFGHRKQEETILIERTQELD
jgi:predicted PurR-regulated permease PerM